MNVKSEEKMMEIDKLNDGIDQALCYASAALQAYRLMARRAKRAEREIGVDNPAVKSAWQAVSSLRSKYQTELIPSLVNMMEDPYANIESALLCRDLVKEIQAEIGVM